MVGVPVVETEVRVTGKKLATARKILLKILCLQKNVKIHYYVYTQTKNMQGISVYCKTINVSVP